ncbi:MAG: DoxX family protein [Phycisphaerae bacterium]|nr:DoxX family protein [Phycisphaerae bacterium]
MTDDLLEPRVSVQLLTGAMLAILFLQSGIDKVVDFAGNLAWLQGHFGKSPLKGQVKAMLIVVTVTEVAAGALCAAGTVRLALAGNAQWAVTGAQLATLNIVMLFLGQRLAKDYAGAAALVPYFILCAAGVIVLST